MNPSLGPLMIIAGVVLVSGCTVPPTADYSEFTQCISDSGVQEFGAYWCPNCARVKVSLGDAYQNINYVECDPKCTPDANGALPAFCNGHEEQTDLCLQKGIDKYPSWVKDGNILYVGTTLEEISRVTGCALPE